MKVLLQKHLYRIIKHYTAVAAKKGKMRSKFETKWTYEDGVAMLPEKGWNQQGKAEKKIILQSELLFHIG